MSDWVKCTGVNGVTAFVNLAAVSTITSYGAGTRLALMGNSQCYMDVAETPTDVLALPRHVREDEESGSERHQDDGHIDNPCSAVDAMNTGISPGTLPITAVP